MTPRTPQVGDTITTGDIRALPGRTILLFHGQVAATPFVWLSDAEILIPPLGVDEPVRVDDFTRGASFTIAYLPGHPPRPERVVKAEALREYADAIYRDLARTNSSSTGYPLVLIAVSALRDRAGRIERGDA